MPKANTQILQTLARLEEAFASLPIPAEGEVVYDNRPEHLECAQIRKRISGRHWRDITAEEIANDSSALYFLTPTAFRFYLPAWARLSLVAWDDVDLAPMALLVALETPGLESLKAIHRERMDGLAENQKDALRASLQLLQELHPSELSAREIQAAIDGMDQDSELGQ
ncbi:MAG: DUF6714 family protein [Acidobacteriota bacterium]|nr:DUF6714 family protein [Acidobacteriota bacterium]